MGYCERKVAFDATVGECTTDQQRAAQGRGLVAHKAFFEESRRLAAGSARKGRCFVATLALGDCEATRALRAFRDVCLRRTATGRWSIGFYYRHSPALCAMLQDRPRSVAVLGAMLRAIAGAAAMVVRLMT